MKLEILDSKDVKKCLKENKIKTPEFYRNKKVFGYKNENGKVIAMLSFLKNKQLIYTKKICDIFVQNNDIDLGAELLNDVLNQKNNDIIYYTDCLEKEVPIFKKCGFEFFTHRNNLKLYNKLWRGIYAKKRID